MTYVVDQAVERVHLVESQRRGGPGFEVDPARGAQVDAHEHPGGDDEERDTRGRVQFLATSSRIG